MNKHLRTKRWLCILFALSIGGATAAPSLADDTETKGLFLYNLAKYVTWPDSAFATDSSPIVIGVAGDSTFADYLASLVEGHPVQGRDLKVITIDPGMAARGVHVVYFPDHDYGRLREQARLFAGHPAIRVAEHERFAKVGDVGFVMHKGRVIFYVNGDNTKREGLRLSSKFMRLASGVE